MAGTVPEEQFSQVH